MDIRNVTEDFSVSPQIAVTDIPTIAKAGFKTIVCNRPDQEQEGQPNFSEIVDAANSAGIQCYHIPVTSGLFGPQHIAQTKEVLETVEGKTLAYCRSGTRSIMLWAFQEVMQRPRDEVLEAARDAGYDLSQQL